ncbi:class I SAM-dependent methyltransferase [Nonomuraea sp. SYSU D8015]|uniref:class I SAM-dependent methyltransferase n=1 Tax=Nonomuraea sp. SYSU D8015 TaxID=2593644 RepID=UPI00166092F0|nr:methyltransferase domain-containing protein [Nonomuraea sp. SYSU D8015]
MRLPTAYDDAWLPRLATPHRGTSYRGDTATLLGAAWRNPRQLGTIAPSSRALARLAASVVPTQGTPTVVELGAGGGAISDVIATRMPSGGRQLAVEINNDLVRHLSRSRPWLQVLGGDAAQLTQLLGQAAVDRVDAVVSALPWTFLPAAHRQSILAELQAVLAPDGILSTIITLTAWPTRSCRVFRHQLASTFGHIEVLGPVWAALPPAVVLTCRKPSHG